MLFVPSQIMYRWSIEREKEEKKGLDDDDDSNDDCFLSHKSISLKQGAWDLDDLKGHWCAYVLEG